WLYTDPLEIAKYQIFEPILMTDFGIFHKGIEQLLGRPVWTHEFGLNTEGLKAEAMKAIERWEAGYKKSSDDYIEDKTQESLIMLEEYCKKSGKKLIKLKDI
ncbi:MAG: hypothetical protein ACE5HX_13315, partial [bacterium]